MLLLCIALAFDWAPGSIGQRPTTRAAFVEAMRKVEDGWSRDQVLKVLGKPDDVWPPNDSSNYVMAGDEAWCYGTDGHHTMPTLGRVVFRDDRVVYKVGGFGDPPSPSIIGEQELVRLMRQMYRKPSRMRFSPFSGDPQRLIRTANLLMPLGKEKALAVMSEYSRLATWNENWLFWLVRTLFEPIGPEGGFRVPRIGAITPSPPDNLRDWPTYPVILIDDVPVLVFRGLSLSGFPEPFEWYVKEESKNWRIKTKRLVPPDDPFPVFLKVLRSPSWPFKGTNVDDAATHILGSYDEVAIPLVEILSLVRTAYKPVGQRDSYDRYPNGLDFAQLHTEFKLSGARWDDKRQVYVRRDGSYTPDEVLEYRQHTYSFESVPGLEIELLCERDNEDTVSYRASVSEVGDPKVRNAIVAVFDVATGKELHWMALNEPPFVTLRERVKTAFLREAPHLPFLKDGHVTGSGFNLEAGRSVRFVVLQGDREFVGPTLVP